MNPNKFILRVVRLNVHGYTYGKYGRYFGNSPFGRVYFYENDNGVEIEDGYIRAKNREEARAQVRKSFPNAVFYN